MNEVYTQFISILYSIWRNRKIALAVAWGISILGWLYISQIPNQFESKTRLHFDTDTVLSPLMQDLTVNNNIYNQILNLRETLLSLENVENTIQNTNIKNLISPTGEPSQEELNFWMALHQLIFDRRFYYIHLNELNLTHQKSQLLSLLVSQIYL